MQDLQSLTEEDLKGLAPEAVAALAQQMLQRLRCQDSELKFKDAKIEKITFQLAQLKAWKFGAKTEAMSAEQRRLFEETLVENEASLQAQLDQARGAAAPPAGRLRLPAARGRRPRIAAGPPSSTARAQRGRRASSSSAASGALRIFAFIICARSRFSAV